MRIECTPSSSGSAASERTRQNMIRTSTCKPRPESGLGCLTCAMFARQLHRRYELGGAICACLEGRLKGSAWVGQITQRYSRDA